MPETREAQLMAIEAGEGGTPSSPHLHSKMAAVLSAGEEHWEGDGDSAVLFN